MKLISHASSDYCKKTLGGLIRHRALSSNKGLSLIECLMAITVIAVSAGMMLPPLFVASATRIQNRKAEQAMQLAQAEVDRIRAIVEQRNPDIETLVPSIIYDGATITNNTFTSVGAPTSIANECRSINGGNNTYSFDNILAGELALPVDTDGIANADGSCAPEFLLQTFRTESGDSNSNLVDDGNNFRMGVRVYAGTVDPTTQTLGTDQATLKYTTGPGQQLVRPLAVMYTNISSVNQSNSMCRFQNIENCP